MAALTPTEATTHLATTSDLEIRVAKIADPHSDIRTKHTMASEIREMLDTVRDSESVRALPYLIPAMLELLRHGEPSLDKDSMEHQFRRVVLEIIHRLPFNEAVRPHFRAIFVCMLHVLRHDNEENGVTACKTMVDITRNYRTVNEEAVTEFAQICQEIFHNAKGLADELLSEHSTTLDQNIALPSIRSFKVIGELGMVMVMLSQVYRPIITTTVQATLMPAFEVLRIESPAQFNARTNHEAMGGIWAGMTSTIKNATAYSDLIQSQIKLLSYLAYVTRFLGDQADSLGESMILSAMRLLQDCPANATPLRKELMVVFRHLLGTPHRKALFNQIDKLFDERVLLGTSIGTKEVLRTMVYSTVADLVHHLKNELTINQVTRIVHVYSRMLHNPAIGNNLHVLFAKMISGLVDSIVSKETPQAAAHLLNVIFETCLQRLEALVISQDDMNGQKKQDSTIPDISLIEKAKPLGASVFAIEKPEDITLESRLVFRALLHGFRVCLAALRKCDAPTSDGTLIFRLFEGCVRCMSLFDPDTRINEQTDAIEWFGHALLEINLHSFQEVWTYKIDFFFQSAQKRIILLNLCQFLFSRETTSPTLLAIVLRYLVDRLPLLGEHDDMTAAATIRLYKMAFGAVGAHSPSNEPILASHLSKLLMDCFPLAAKATKPLNYYFLLRALFRAIGGGGGRFELLYKEVLPLLPEMLESLNRQLLASEGTTRDTIVELCLTVPLRLTHLLPHLNYLMQPLATALRGSPESISQGLRTLELCIDNLTPDFLDPTLNTVLRELMEALFNLLKPLPASHHHAHTTIRILGKMGGRNRRLLTKEPHLKYQDYSEPAKMSVSFGGIVERFDISHLSKLATQTLGKETAADRTQAYDFLENCVVVLLHEGVRGRNAEASFTSIVEGIYDAIHLPETNRKAEAFLLRISRTIFEMEIRRSQTREAGIRPSPSTLLTCFLDAIPHALASNDPNQTDVAQALLAHIINDLVSMASERNVSTNDVLFILHQIANRFAALCLDDPWVRKKAGCRGVQIMTQTPELGAKWITDRDVDLVRTLLHILKDLPHDLPRDVDDVVEVLISVLRISNTDMNFQLDSVNHVRSKLFHLVGIFFPELQSSNPVVRQAAQRCIAFLETLSDKPPTELLMPHRDRMLGGIYAKPLRALPFGKQIGMIEAVRYCVTLDPPLVEMNDEFLRLLHETLALADADDAALVGRGSLHPHAAEITRLRVACIKLLTASMPLTDFFSRQHQTRQRVTSVYFKSLYFPYQEVKEVAHEGLRRVLIHQSRLPKELLQTGLRPILTNLADAKRLSVLGLEGLARLLELLTNYFKVEIGHKLLDHFRVVADPQMLQASSRLPLPDNEGILKLVMLANIFHLLPAAANIFLEGFVNAVVQTEAQMHCSTKSPFSEPLAKYLDRYPIEGIDFFINKIGFPRYLRTFRSIIQAKLAPNLERELASRTSILVNNLIGPEARPLPALRVLKDLADLSPSWLLEYDYVIDALLDIWNQEIVQPENSAVIDPEVVERHSLMLEIFIYALKRSCRVDLLFDILAAYTRNLGMDLLHVTRFFYEHVASSTDLIFKRNILMRFLTWFKDNTVSWLRKTYCFRYIVTPMLVLHAASSVPNNHLIGVDFINRLHTMIWHPNVEIAFAETDDVFKIELLHLTTVLVHHYSELLEDARKDIIKCAWHFVTTNDEILVKQTAYLLLARFFAAFQTPQKFILRAWTGLLRLPHSEGRSQIRQEALATLAPSLPRTDPGESGFPQWAKTTRRLLAEEGLAQIIAIYHLIVKQPQLFYPVRSLFIPHMTNALSKLGLANSSSTETRLLTLDILQVIFSWEEQAIQANAATEVESVWLTPLGFRENMVSYLVRLATIPHDQPVKALLVPRTLSLLQMMVGPKGWSDVTVGLRFFSRALEQVELSNEVAVSQALSSAKVLQVIAAEQPEAWYTANASILNKLVRKGLISEDSALQDALHPLFDKLIQLFPLPKEDEEQQGEMSEFHNFVSSSIGDSLRNPTVLRGQLLMLKSIVRDIPERIEPFGVALMKVLSKLAKDHVTLPMSPGYESGVHLIILILDICQLSIANLGDQRRWLLTTLVFLIDKSKNVPLCRYLLDMARTWALLKRQDAYPTMKEKASLLQKMASLENRSETIFHSYLELIYDIYTEPTLRRSDLTMRLEISFLLGCRAKDPVLRERFMNLLDLSVPRSLLGRLTYVLGVQNWEGLADHHWIYLALHLVLGAADPDLPGHHERRISLPTSVITLSRPKPQCLLQPMRHLLFLDPQVAHETWVSLFPALWTCLSRREQADITHHMINLLSKDYHLKQTHLRPNVIQTLLAGAHTCVPAMTLPPHLVKYLAKMFGAWHIGLEILETTLEQTKEDDQTIRDYVFDSLADVYAELAEEDMFYGLWRRRSLHEQTNIALAYEQNGMWEQASNAYEVAQSKARAGAIPFSENEYCLWEDHWILSAEKLQQWDLLYDLAKGESNYELMLESAWRIKEWADHKETLEEQISHLPEVPTPRRRVFEAFISLLKNPSALEKNVEFTKYLEDAMQLSLRKWISLPIQLSAAHVPLLQHFQQFVELQEAVQIYGSLSQTNAQNLEKRSSELKMVLQAWRERLPHLHDDINIWSDLVAWRQNVFQSINNAYIPLTNGTNQNGTATSNPNTYGYRGYHETAWIINRFAHVARKHDLLDVCFTQLNKIYTLPNIEISEAFLKLREQARCHYQKPNDLQAGLEVINNTNLMFFSTLQKAEFYTMKGMFHARLGRNDEANFAFGQAVQLDTSQPKAWAEWGKYNDRMFKENPTELSYAANAVSCYLQAAGLYKSNKCRPLLTRILWLLSVDDNALTISRAFDTYKGDAAFWYWIPLIPQLCLSLSHREAKQARYLLHNLARHYPQAVFYQLRTTREEMQFVKKAAAARAASLGQGSTDATRRSNSEQAGKDGIETAVAEPGTSQSSASQPVPDVGHSDRAQPATTQSIAAVTMENTPVQPRQPWEYVDEILQALKTTFPLLILSLETMVDQIQHKFKLSPEEDIYRNVCMLLQDAVQNYVLRMNAQDDDGLLAPQTVQTLMRMAQNMPGHVKKEYEDEFLHSKPSHYEYIQRLQEWRDRYEKLLDSRPRVQPLAVLSHYLTEFQYSKVDEIEVPGQYTEDKDTNQNFIRIQKFAPKFEYCRSNGVCWKRFTLLGHDNSKTSFTVQLPCHRQIRREDRVMQILRTFNGVLARKKESRKRNLTFHVPAAVSCSPNVRLFQTDSSYISLGDIYERHCVESGIAREEPILYAGEKAKKVMREFRQSASRQLTKAEYIALKKEIYDEIALKLVPDNVLSGFMMRTMDDPSELWKMRKQFALQLAACSFITYVFCLSSRHPPRFHISRTTGRMAMTELLPGASNQMPVFATSDVVPFRFTPNMQTFLGPIFTEGILTSSMMAIARSLTEPEFELEQQLCLLGRDEVAAWLSMRGRPWTIDLIFRQSVAMNIDGIVKRAETMACKTERDSALQTNTTNQSMVPVVQTVTNLISTATNPLQLAKMGELYHPWF
ncbi:hypothetical protein AMATHDRAFT_1809 [Amanita thiersii Skay4041]|uniref:FAT domain-containing protein n=1 Tax=Amanita thiersii Skay4041 TaxID=703135 RepID=A0A2A9NY70_9AGAR|nr:hypothetical protein AMATHDRAFT_1809 [Amanita thiersii Skay4041]